MIAFGSSIGDAEVYRRYAQPGVELAREDDSAVLPFCGVTPAARAFNLILDAAAHFSDLEALVLLAPHVEITDPQLCTKVRSALQDPAVGALGLAGGSPARSIAWWEGLTASAEVAQTYNELGGGRVPGFSWARPAPAPAEVEALDGQLLVLSAEVVREVRFDERLPLEEGLDFDLCQQIRDRGYTLMVVDLRTTLHRSLKFVDNLELWTEAHIRVAEKWSDALGGAADEDAWKRRARRAEAEREAAHAFAFSRSLELDARVEELERELDRCTNSLSWRLTRPLREVNRWRRERAATGHAREPQGGDTVMPSPPGPVPTASRSPVGAARE